MMARIEGLRLQDSGKSLDETKTWRNSNREAMAWSEKQLNQERVSGRIQFIYGGFFWLWGWFGIAASPPSRR
jgi:hypothetical protein